MWKICRICSKSVYPMDPQINIDGTILHKPCAKCLDCKCQITLTNFAKYETPEIITLLCKTHYLKRYHESGVLLGSERFQNKKPSEKSSSKLASQSCNSEPLETPHVHASNRMSAKLTADRTPDSPLEICRSSMPESPTVIINNESIRNSIDYDFFHPIDRASIVLDKRDPMTSSSSSSSSSSSLPQRYNTTDVDPYTKRTSNDYAMILPHSGYISHSRYTSSDAYDEDFSSALPTTLRRCEEEFCTNERGSMFLYGELGYWRIAPHYLDES